MCVCRCDCECVYVRVCVSVCVSVHTGQVAWCDQNDPARGTVVLPGFVFTAVFYGHRVVPLPAQRGSRSGGGVAQLEATLGPCEPLWSAAPPQFNQWDWEVRQSQWGGQGQGCPASGDQPYSVRDSAFPGAFRGTRKAEALRCFWLEPGPCSPVGTPGPRSLVGAELVHGAEGHRPGEAIPAGNILLGRRHRCGQWVRGPSPGREAGALEAGEGHGGRLLGGESGPEERWGTGGDGGEVWACPGPGAGAAGSAWMC